MFHDKFAMHAHSHAIPTAELSLRAFVSEHEKALENAACLLAGSRGLRLVNNIRDGLDQPGKITRRVRRMLHDLRCILFLDYEDPWGDVDYSILEPDDPIVPELCLLADGFDEVLCAANIYKTPADT